MPICIAGMHRSGTSMVTRLLNLCGLYLGEPDELFQADANNSEGYWENFHLVGLNDKLLIHLGGAWDVPPVYPTGWVTQPNTRALRVEAQKTIERLGTQPPWGWKDPRNSFTLPFWKTLIPDLKTVICLRHPIDVARSLQARGGSSLLWGINLWMVYNQRLIETTAPGERIITHYDAYHNKPADEIRRLLDTLGINTTDEIIQRACQAISRSSRRQAEAELETHTRFLPDSVLQLYTRLCDEAGWRDATNRSVTDSIAGDSEASADPLLSEDQRQAARLMALEVGLADRERRILTLNENKSHLQARVANLNENTSQLQTRIANLNENTSQLQARIANLNKRIQTLQDSVNSITAENSELQSQISTLTNGNEALAAQLQATQVIAEVASHEVETLHNSKYYKAASAYWKWRDRLRRILSWGPSEPPPGQQAGLKPRETTASRVQPARTDGWHRAAIGALWEEMGQLQFDFLRSNGLQESHYLLDIGCGSLRGGVHFIRYLRPGHYFGVDRDKALLDTGRELELGHEQWLAKRPQLVEMSDFNFVSLNQKFDFALAQSLFTHLPLNSIIRCLTTLGAVMQAGGRFYATFFENPGGKQHLGPLPQPRTDGPAYLSFFDQDPYHYDFETFQWICEGTRWKVEYIGDWHHPRNQKMMVFVLT